MLVQLDRMKKEYDGFSLELNMEIPENQVTGLIGANGAGKSTTFKLMLGLIRPDEGNVEIFGRNAAEMGAEDKQKIGAVFSDSGFSEYLKVQQLIPIMSRFYPDFQEEEFRGRCERFKIPLNKQIKEFSTGMKAKLNVLLALSHDSRLLILDEPTAGLDVVAREEILDLLREYMEIPGRSIVISSHISGDLEHFCDDLYMIHEGKIVLHEETDRILEEYGFLKVSEQEYEALDKEYLLRVRKESFGYSCLTNQKNYYLENYPGIIVEKGSVDEVISMLVKGRTVMRGLLMKDLELIKINMKMYLAVFLIGIIYLVAQENGSTFFVAYAIFVSIGVSVGTISYDGYHHGMKFLMTLPVTKKQYVQSKYLLSFGFAVLVSVISLLLGMIRIQISGKQEAEDLLISAGTALVISCIILCGMIPLRLKYEAEKSRIVMVAAVAVIFLVAAVCKELYDVYQKSFGKGLQFLDTLSGWQIAVGLIVVMMICLAVSVKVSERIMEKKEF